MYVRPPLYTKPAALNSRSWVRGQQFRKSPSRDMSSSSADALAASASTTAVSASSSSTPLPARVVASAPPVTPIKWEAEEGDVVILYAGNQATTAVRLVSGKSTENKFGRFYHSDMIGKWFGSRITARIRGEGAIGFITMLRFTPELWTVSLVHRTQILYAVDIATVIAHLDLRPGKRVVESGTGSGSLTTSLARAVAPHGHVFTFEFNATRVDKARAEFKENGIANVVTVAHADACVDGFGAALADSVDGVFLDLPQPWLAIPHAKAVLKAGASSVCSFSPCIEQVQACADALAAHGFEDIRTLEVLTRPYDVFSWDVPVMVVPGLTDASQEVAPTETRKRARMEEVAAPAAAQVTADTSALVAAAADAPMVAPLPGKRYPASILDPLPVSARPAASARGHTGFLTFAKLYHK